MPQATNRFKTKSPTVSAMVRSFRAITRLSPGDLRRACPATAGLGATRGRDKRARQLYSRGSVIANRVELQVEALFASRLRPEHHDLANTPRRADRNLVILVDGQAEQRARL